MRVAVVSDIHSNLEALIAVFRDAESDGPIDAVWCAGDIVGYGADPLAVIAGLRAADAKCVAGNHDLAACGLMGTEDFNPIAASAAEWTRDTLTDDARAWLTGLPLVRRDADTTIVHGTLRAPEWEYLMSPEQAEAHFALQETPVSIVGHTHLQFAAVEREGARPAFTTLDERKGLALEDQRVILNPGSVGQPRDGDPRAGYLLYDVDERIVTWVRVEYDVASAQRKIIDAGLDRRLADRLAVGR
jgi:predicted phosphodiesterase